MSFLKRLMKGDARGASAQSRRSSFDNLSDDQIEGHLRIARYGSFMLTEAVRPSYNLDVVPSAGYRQDQYRDKETGGSIPVTIVSQTKHLLMDLFIDLLEPLGDEVDVVLETSHGKLQCGRDDLYRESIDLPILKSTLYDFEDLLINDGCTGLAVLNPRLPLEVQFDEHKLILLYGQDNRVFEDVLEKYSLDARPEMRFITEAEHVHSTGDDYWDQFCQLKYRLGIDD